MKVIRKRKRDKVTTHFFYFLVLGCYYTFIVYIGAPNKVKRTQFSPLELQSPKSPLVNTHFLLWNDEFQTIYIIMSLTTRNSFEKVT